jgi:hypothetical protein
MYSRTLDPESSASANFAIWAKDMSKVKRQRGKNETNITKSSSEIKIVPCLIEPKNSSVQFLSSYFITSIITADGCAIE